MSSLKDAVTLAAIDKTLASSKASVTLIRLCVAGNKDCFINYGKKDTQPNYITGDFGWKQCTNCKKVVMKSCSNESCPTNDPIKRVQLYDDIQLLEKECRKFVRQDGTVICVVCSVVQNHSRDVVTADLSIEDESGNRYFDEDGAKAHGILFQDTSYAEKHNNYLLDKLVYEENRSKTKAYIKNLKRKIELHVNEANTSTVTSSSSSSSSSSSTSSNTQTLTIIRHPENVDSKPNIEDAFSQQERVKQHRLYYDPTYDSSLKIENTTEVDAKQALSHNLESKLTEREYKLFKQIEMILNGIGEFYFSSFNYIINRDASLAKRVAKLVAYSSEYIKLYHNIKRSPSNRNLKIAIFIMKELASHHPKYFVSYQRVFDVCFSYNSDDEDYYCDTPDKKTKEIDTEDEDKNNITIGRFLGLCQDLEIYYPISSILTYNFLTSASMYLIERFVLHKNTQNETKQMSLINETNKEVMKQRIKVQIQRYLDMVDSVKVEEKFKKMHESHKSKSSSSSTTSNNVSKSLSLELTVIIPAILLIMSTEKLHNSCRYKMMGQDMADVINTTDTTISSIKRVILIEKRSNVDQTVSSKLHDIKKAWIIDSKLN